MEYRVLGRTGLKISAVSLGGWLTHGNTVALDTTRAIVRRALDLGINHLDTADVYAQGEAERALGHALEGLRRSSYVLASKVFWPTGPGPNDRGLSRKHIHETCAASLARLRTDYLDIFYCHRYDPEVPLEETVRAMEDLVAQGRILHWGVSCWTPDQIRAACRLASRHQPVVDQPPYNLFDRAIEDGVIDACREEGMGIAVWSPLAQGVLTGKYLTGVPGDSRAANPKVNKFVLEYLAPPYVATVRALKALSDRCDIPMGRLALGWCLRRPEVTSVIVGATSVAQLEESAAAAVPPADVVAELDRIAREAPLHRAG